MNRRMNMSLLRSLRRNQGALAAIDMALLRSFANRFKAPTHAQKRNEAFHEPLQFERCCGWVLPARGNPTQPRSAENEVHGPNAYAKRNEALREPSSR